MITYFTVYREQFMMILDNNLERLFSMSENYSLSYNIYQHPLIIY